MSHFSVLRCKPVVTDAIVRWWSKFCHWFGRDEKMTHAFKTMIENKPCGTLVSKEGNLVDEDKLRGMPKCFFESTPHRNKLWGPSYWLSFPNFCKEMFLIIIFFFIFILDAIPKLWFEKLIKVINGVDLNSTFCNDVNLMKCVNQ